ncbi:hypothetical protein STEG23_013698 [Scotinomys teguina]
MVQLSFFESRRPSPDSTQLLCGCGSWGKPPENSGHRHEEINVEKLQDRILLTALMRVDTIAFMLISAEEPPLSQHVKYGVSKDENLWIASRLIWFD